MLAFAFLFRLSFECLIAALDRAGTALGNLLVLAAWCGRSAGNEEERGSEKSGEGAGKHSDLIDWRKWSEVDEKSE